MSKRFWIDNNPIEKPYGENTYGVVDKKAGGVVLYTGTAFLAQFVQILFERNEGGVPLVEIKQLMPKPLAQYLAEYLSRYLNGETLPCELLEQALDAYEFTENVRINFIKVKEKA